MILENQYYDLAPADVVSVVECTDCRFLYTDPIPSDAWNRRFLDPSVNTRWTDPVWKTIDWQNEHSAVLYEEGLQIVGSRVSGGRLLDVGTGAGSFVLIAREAGYDAIGLEIECEQVRRARVAGIPVIGGPVDELARNDATTTSSTW